MTTPGRSWGPVFEAGAGCTCPVIQAEPHCEAVSSIPQLIAEKRGGPDVAWLADNIRAMGKAEAHTLILRLATTSDPLGLWALHLELDRRGIPPCLRWPANTDTPQAVFITLLADLLWIARRNVGHVSRFRGWQGLFKHPAASPTWHAVAHRQFLFVSTRYGLAHWCSKGLALGDAQRKELMMLPTRSMVADRRQLNPELLANMRDRLLGHAIERPDRSGRLSPEAIASRRTRLWCVFVLAGRDHTATARHWRTLTGEALSRQAVAKQTAIVRGVLRDHG